MPNKAEKPKVACHVKIYVDGKHVGDEERRLLIGYQYSSWEHLPSGYDSSDYVLVKVEKEQGQITEDVTSEPFTCPDQEFILHYKFKSVGGPPDPGGGGEAPVWEIQEIASTSVKIVVDKNHRNGFDYFLYDLYLNGEIVESSSTVNGLLKLWKMTFSDLIPDTQYSIKVTWGTAAVDASEADGSETRYFQTKPADAADVPEWTVKDISSSSAVIEVTDPRGWLYFSYSVRLSGKKDPISPPTEYSKNLQQGFNKLKPETAYDAVLSWSTKNVGEGNYQIKPFTTGSVNINRWSWDVSNGEYTNGNASLTKNAQTAINNKGSTVDFSHLVWNDMVSKLFQVVHALGGYFDKGPLSYEETLMSSTDKIMKAARFNTFLVHLNYHLQKRNLTQLTFSVDGVKRTSFDPGDAVKGKYFADLATALNRLIDSM